MKDKEKISGYKMMTRKQAAELIGVCYNTIINWEKSGMLTPSIKMPSGRPRYLPEDFARAYNKMVESQKSKISNNG